MPEPISCRHEFVRIFQRKLKGLERRLVATKAYLPIGFKQGDFGHLSEGSYCFCTKCRARLFPKRTQAERLKQKLAQAEAASLAQVESAKLADELALAEALEAAEALSVLEADEVAENSESVPEDKMSADIHVDELEVESVDVEDIEAEGVKLTDSQEDATLCEEDL